MAAECVDLPDSRFGLGIGGGAEGSAPPLRQETRPASRCFETKAETAITGPPRPAKKPLETRIRLTSTIIPGAAVRVRPTIAGDGPFCSGAVHAQSASFGVFGNDNRR